MEGYDIDACASSLLCTRERERERGGMEKHVRYKMKFLLVACEGVGLTLFPSGESRFAFTLDPHTRQHEIEVHRGWWDRKRRRFKGGSSCAQTDTVSHLIPVHAAHRKTQIYIKSINNTWEFRKFHFFFFTSINFLNLYKYFLRAISVIFFKHNKWWEIFCFA